ncbi:MAG: hypothetical protein C0602_03860 [Denitrovibrio sp.]|nr:MAG: hypothetical protein C0602_03860 [Denitrovibrio sp.]
MTQQSALYKKFEVVLLDKSGKGGNWIDNLQDILDKHSISADCIADIIDDVFANNPDAKFIYSRYALLLMKHGFTDMAEQAFQKDYSYYNQAWSHSMKYAECLTINNKHNQAEELIQKVYGRHPGAVNGYTASAMVLFSRGYPETASRFALKDLFQRRFTSFYLKHIVKILLSTGERQTAIDEINKIVSEK